MKNFLLLSVILLLSTLCSCAVQPGSADFASYAHLLKGKRVAVVANHTSMVGDSHLVDFLRSKNVDIRRIFCPEHGFRGTADAGESVGSYTDKKTGLPVVSLYGKKKKPQQEDLADIDVLIFDIQDIGVRFYTYLSTLHYVMESCAENSLPVIVMDRPNPHVSYVDGPVMQKECMSFVGMHPVPIVYGMTIGEYARMINGEGWLKNAVQCDLTVIECKGWKRSMNYELTCKPSPNLPDKVSVMLYPSTCLFEGTVISEGRGTYTPFQIFGHPDLKDMPYHFIPKSIPGMSKSPKCLGKTCYGMDLRGEYGNVCSHKAIHLSWLITAYKAYLGKAPFFVPFFDKLAGTPKLKKDIIAGKSEQEIKKSWIAELNDFKKIRAKYLIYE